MGNLKINKKYGFIEGGLCHQRIKDRKQRSDGCGLAWYFAQKQEGCVEHKKSWYRMLRQPKINVEKEIFGTHTKLGVYRMLQGTFAKLIESGQWFRLKWMEDWIEGTASAEFFMSADSPIAFDTILCGLIPPKGDDDAIYEKMYGVRRGILKESN